MLRAHAQFLLLFTLDFWSLWFVDSFCCFVSFSFFPLSLYLPILCSVFIYICSPENEGCKEHTYISTFCRWIYNGRGWGGWGGDQAYSRLSTSEDHITDCKVYMRVYSVVYAGVGVESYMYNDVIWTALVWPERSTRESFWMPSHRLNSATGEQKGITRTIILTQRRPVDCLTH